MFKSCNRILSFKVLNQVATLLLPILNTFNFEKPIKYITCYFFEKLINETCFRGTTSIADRHPPNHCIAPRLSFSVFGPSIFSFAHFFVQLKRNVQAFSINSSSWQTLIASFAAYCLLISTRRASASLPPAPISTNIGGFISTLVSATPADAAIWERMVSNWRLNWACVSWNVKICIAYTCLGTNGINRFS